jgi:hypothetical protein
MSRTPAGRNESFVRAARRLLAFQLAAAAGAVALTAWAVIEVRELVHERDRLAAQVAQIEQRGPAAAAPRPLEPEAASEPPAEIAAEPVAEPPEASEPDREGNVSGSSPPPPPPPPPQSRIECELLDGTSTLCPLPWRRVADGICLDVEGRRAHCPTGGSPPGGGGEGSEPDPPPPARDCRSVEGRPIVCAPPFRATPVPRVCLDRNNRPMRCPPGQPPRERDPVTGAIPTRPPTTRPAPPTVAQPSGTTRPSGTARPSGTSRPRPTTSTARPTLTRPAPPATTVPATRQPSVTATTPPRTVRPATTAPGTTRPAPVRRRQPPPDSNQAQPR